MDENQTNIEVEGEKVKVYGEAPIIFEGDRNTIDGEIANQERIITEAQNRIAELESYKQALP